MGKSNSRNSLRIKQKRILVKLYKSVQEKSKLNVFKDTSD